MNNISIISMLSILMLLGASGVSASCVRGKIAANVRPILFLNGVQGLEYPSNTLFRQIPGTNFTANTEYDGFVYSGYVGPTELILNIDPGANTSRKIVAFGFTTKSEGRQILATKSKSVTGLDWITFSGNSNDYADYKIPTWLSNQNTDTQDSFSRLQQVSFCARFSLDALPNEVKTRLCHGDYCIIVWSQFLDVPNVLFPQ